MSGTEPTHGDILYKIGELKGQVDTLIVLVGQKREDLNAAFTRLGAIEQSAASHVEFKELAGKVNRVENAAAKWGGFALACSFIVPLIVTAAQPYLHLGGKPASAITHEARP